MTGSILKKLATLTLGTTLMLGLAEAMPAQAAVLTYSFSNSSKTLNGTFSFDSVAASDQLVTVSEGLKIVANFGGQTYTELDDIGATVFTDFSGNIANGQFLGLNFSVAAFSVTQDNFISVNAVEVVTYNTVPEPASILGLSVLGLGLLLGKKSQSSKA